MMTAAAIATLILLTRFPYRLLVAGTDIDFIWAIPPKITTTKTITRP
jgi:hypothetical protein